jgi:hypothetical protein
MLAGALTANVPGPDGRIEHSETLTASGITPASRVFLSLAPVSDADENDAELIDLTSIAAAPGTGQLTVAMTFAAPVSGPIKLIYGAL